MSSSLCSSRCDSRSGGLGANIPERVLQEHGLYFRKLTPRDASLHITQMCLDVIQLSILQALVRLPHQ